VVTAMVAAVMMVAAVVRVLVVTALVELRVQSSNGGDCDVRARQVVPQHRCPKARSEAL